MQAVIQTGGKQYKVQKGLKFQIEKLESEPGTEIVLSEVLLVDGETVQVGTPYVAGAKVTLKVLEQQKTKKVVVAKYKRRKGYHKKQGHRQNVTLVEVQDISI